MTYHVLVMNVATQGLRQPNMGAEQAQTGANEEDLIVMGLEAYSFHLAEPKEKKYKAVNHPYFSKGVRPSQQSLLWIDVSGRVLRLGMYAYHLVEPEEKTYMVGSRS